MPSRRQLANAIRALSMDAVQKANSGHPGMPMGMADIAEVLWNRFLQHNPNNPNWINRDRFVLSNGHGSMLLYSLLHLTGYDVSLEDLKAFRQLHSKTPGHPEYGYAAGVETTTGPLGQGLANAVGFALAERVLSAHFNRDGHEMINHHTYAFCGDGCLMEGISHEACSLAGTLRLGKLIVMYDDNGISIDGDVRQWFTDDTPARFQAYGWQVIANVDGHDADAIQKAIEQAQAETQKPTLICCKTVIGFGSPSLAGSEKTHGAPLGDDEIAATRKAIDWPYAAFEISDAIYAGWNAQEKGQLLEQRWNEKLAKYQHKHPKLAAELMRRSQGELPSNWQEHAQQFIAEIAKEAPNLATRKASQRCIEAYASILPEMLGGSADLTGSNNTNWYGTRTISTSEYDGNYVYYGVREFAMAAVMNGLALHGGFIPYGGTFLVFADYMRNAMRLSAIMKQRVIYVLTHDSIGLGEDGPTHQPVEHATMLRITPNMMVWRPCDAVETAVAWRAALERQDGPTSLLLSRQTLPHQARDRAAIDNIQRGGYILQDCKGTADVIIIATGSEVALATEAAARLSQAGKAVRVVSMPSATTFAQQDTHYQQHVLPNEVSARVAVEAGASAFWYQYVGMQGKIIGLDRFGESAPAADIYQAVGITVDAVVDAVNSFTH